MPGSSIWPAPPPSRRKEREQLIAFDQGRTFRSPLTEELVGARVDLERRMIRELGAAAVVTGSNLTSFISARAEGVPLYYPVPFALTEPQVRQAQASVPRRRARAHRAIRRSRRDRGLPLDLHPCAARAARAVEGREGERRATAANRRLAPHCR